MKYEFEKTDLTIYYATIEADSFEDAVSQLGKADWNMSDGWIDELGYQDEEMDDYEDVPNELLEEKGLHCYRY